MAIPSVGRLIESEGDVTGPAGLKPNDAYDLALYEDPHGAGKGILIVKTVLQILFRSGKDARGNKLEWDGASRQRFLSNYSSTVCNVWDNKHRIVTASTTPAVRDIGVFFKLDLVVREWYLHEHWEVEVVRTDEFAQSSVTPFLGNVDLDSQDATGVCKRSATLTVGRASSVVCLHEQRGAAHEFGHMLGLRDEYPEARDNLNWTGDAASIMHSGEEVRPRHYAIFADWLTKQYAHAAHLARTPIEFKVAGTWDLSNSKL